MNIKRLVVLLTIANIATGCGSMRLTNEDAGGVMIASDLTAPVNGKVIVTVERKPNTSEHARRYYQDMGVNRSFLGWYGQNVGPKANEAGRVKQHIGEGS
jgi:hypothetical protein